MTLLLLVRHGLTDATGTRLTGWTPGVHLSDRGKEQARGIADRLAGVPLAGVYTSPLERCRETAEPLAAARRLIPNVREDLGEVRYGTWTGRSLSQLYRTKLWKRVQQVPSGVRFPEGESLLEVQERAAAEVARIGQAHPKGTVAVFSHGDVIKALLAHYAGTHLDLFQRWLVEPASVSAVALGEGIPRILKVNDTGSLADLAPKRPATSARRTGTRS